MRERIKELLGTTDAGRRALETYVSVDFADDAEVDEGEQTTKPGSRVVTVARHGANMAKSSVGSHPIYTTAIYEAKPRQADKKLTWRRVGSVGQTTSGNSITSNMKERAKAHAEALGHPYQDGVRHGNLCE